ncbi:hypothetical protein HMPREF2534_01565 [Bacteroides thetaiotaomicron]|nr:hypothetical protein HMPREF2534_01565 [Bacteroides thetaiotaomicron]
MVGKSYIYNHFSCITASAFRIFLHISNPFFSYFKYLASIFPIENLKNRTFGDGVTIPSA